MEVTNPYLPSFMGIHPGIQEGISRLAFLFVRQDMTYPGVFISPCITRHGQLWRRKRGGESTR
jgi:hypothetical protein